MTDETIVVPPEPDTQPAPPDPPDMAAVREYFSTLQLDLSKRIAAIEMFLGFTEGVEALGVRVARLESFLGVK